MGEVNARLQHAVEHDEVVDNVSIQRPSETSVPKKGEIVFNRDITNFKVGDGTKTYGQLNNFIKSIAAASGSDIADVGTPSVTASTSGNTTTFTFHQLKGATGNTGNPGPQGTGINHIRKTSGSGAAGTTDTYTIYSSVEESASTILGTFNVYNGSDGNGISVKASAADCTEVGDAYIDRDSTSQTYGHIMILTSTNPREFTDGGNVQGPIGPQGPQGVQGTAGTDGVTPHIDSTTGNWFIGSTDTGIHAQGEQGVGIGSIVPPSTPGQTTDVYTIMSDEQTPSQLGIFTVYNGEDGEAGTDGATWHSGTDVTSITSNVPSGVVVGDYYLNTNTYNVYKCISTTDSTKWSLECNIKGSQGDPGSNGVSVNHISWTSNSGGQPQGTQGTDDTYTAYSSSTESQATSLGTFVVHNGADGSSTSRTYYDCSTITTSDHLRNFFNTTLINNINNYKGIVIPANIVLNDIDLRDAYLNFIVDYSWFVNLQEGSSFEIFLMLTPRTSSQVTGISFITSDMDAPDSSWEYASVSSNKYYRKKFDNKLSTSDGTTRMIGGICKITKWHSGGFFIT